MRARLRKNYLVWEICGNVHIDVLPTAKHTVGPLYGRSKLATALLIVMGQVVERQRLDDSSPESRLNFLWPTDVRHKNNEMQMISHNAIYIYIHRCIYA